MSPIEIELSFPLLDLIRRMRTLAQLATPLGFLLANPDAILETLDVGLAAVENNLLGDGGMLDGLKLPMIGTGSVRESLRDDFVGALRRNVVQVCVHCL